MKPLKLLILFVIISFTNCDVNSQNKQNENLEDKISDIDNKVTENHKLVPSTKIYFVLPEDAVLNNNVVQFGNIAIQVMQIDDKTTKTTIEDFEDPTNFEKQGISVLSSQRLKINGVNSIALKLNNNTGMKGYIYFIDNNSEKVMISAYYPSYSKEEEKKLNEVLKTIVYAPDLTINPEDNMKFEIDLSNTEFKFCKYNASFYLYTINGEESSFEKPQIIISELPYNNESLESIANHTVSQSEKYGVKNIKTNFIKKSENLIEYELRGKIEGKTFVSYNKILRDDIRQIIINFQGTARKNVDKYLKKYAVVSTTLKIK